MRNVDVMQVDARRQDGADTIYPHNYIRVAPTEPIRQVVLEHLGRKQVPEEKKCDSDDVSGV